ncbi:MAG: hypothetical protein HGA87_04845 [Desulfobulbaceae bacterium]|nr:hypothetical protein [Desulfobulbaceae bacterium]
MSAWLDGTVQLWNPFDASKLQVLEGHADAVTSVDFSYDGQFLASKSNDETVRIWRCNNWETVAIFEETVSGQWFSCLAFHPHKPVLATLSEQDTAIHIWQLDTNALLSALPVTPTVHYMNAKVVLVGDSGVGKSGLGLVLSNHNFTATESTHGRHVWAFDQRPALIGGERVETHETLLWDLAGQPGYRIIHQLHLNEVAVALVVFDSRSEIDPFAGVRHWDRALRLASRVQSAAPPLKKFLVAARADRGGIPVSVSRIERLVQDLGFDGYFETSAREGWGVDTLKAAIHQAIDWSALPRVSSTKLFQQIKDFLIKDKQTGRVLATVDDLYRSFLRSSQIGETGDLRAQFETCIGRVESRGLIRWLSFGGFVLLQPELLDAYASALINAVKDEPDGMGSIAEEDARAGRFRMSQDERIKDKDQEHLLLIATVEELLHHEIALREPGDDGAYLIFPSQFTREWPDAPDLQRQSMLFSFEGPVVSIYATLAVRLSRSSIFTKKDMWKNAATYTTVSDGIYGMFLRERGEGVGEIILFYDGPVSKEMCQSFENYIRSHLRRRALPETIQERRFVICSHCGQTLPEQQVRYRLQTGKTWIMCGYCDTKNQLSEQKQELSAAAEANLPAMDWAADQGRTQDALDSILQGKAATGDYDLFLCHYRSDRAAVAQFAEKLKKQGLLPLLYDEGSWSQLKAKLRATLAELYPETTTSHRIVDDVGLPRNKITFSTNALDNWHTILTEADKHNKIATILKFAFDDYSENIILAQIKTQMLQFAKAIVLCIGRRGGAIWEQPDIDTALHQFVKDSLPIIPVLLPGATQQPEIPPFLQSATTRGFYSSLSQSVVILKWIDIRQNDPNHFQVLLKSLRAGKIVDK